ncbi:MAG: F0F1 ATP synthase subunit gamma [Rhizobiales bacterium]|nr:F0F1 ATP synthase subunit gamma [Hyphomicrobiales bacterium]MBO6700044.1 F0F1 ATP synthase subunit gamma [Hyphomicrobiales bacterium]MBO6737791.1 F0F1 ATP synthase subunit gamma [Hyphomicrobiales bacterium]MBO6913152.1 F0F1 ATP synthase subunit gamma [Hyphomicrobiales bacterium]MBO6954196.1 F0F1 ATP synthase subunit gamma [Hyphomicrobiales bacterium]
MPSLKDLRNRIASVTATRKITKAMQMVAAAKLRRAQSSAEAARPYAEKMSAVLSNLAAGQMSGGGEGASPLIAGTGSDKVHLLVVATAERGLCGGFNSSIVRLARKQARELIADGKEVKLLTVGKKGYDQLKRDMSSRIEDRIEFRGVKSVGYAQAEEVSAKIMEMFEAGEFDVCTLYYAAFKSVISQVPTAHQLIPAKFEVSEDPVFYEYEPDENAILDDLLPRNLTVQVFKALLENAASEQGARMAAMDNATRNAGEMIDALTLSYNRQRQAQITKELIEIISGAEAL